MTRVTSMPLDRLVPLGAGAIALVVAVIAGRLPDLVSVVAGPPAIVRAILVGGAVVVALACLREALVRLDRSANPGVDEQLHLPTMVRGIRFVFLSIAAFAAAGGWLIGDPLPLIVALVIAGIDVLETSFLLLVVATRRPDR